jgi:hypothetical protein
MRGAIPSLRHTSSWRSAYLSTGYVFRAWHLGNKGTSPFTFTTKNILGKELGSADILSIVYIFI